MKDLSIIIVNYKGGEKLISCLESLQLIDESRFSFEVIVVDNHPDDGSQARLIHRFPHFKFISNTGNNGFANGCNLGASRSKGLHLLFLNPDTTVTTESLNDMLQEICVRPEFSIVSCSQVREDGSMDRPYGKFLTISTLTGWLRAIHRFFYGKIEDTVEQTKNYLYPDWVSGSVVMISSDSFNRLGKWDDDFWMYFEDVDLCRRASQCGGEIVNLKNAVVGHFHGGSSRSNLEVTVLTKAEVHISRHVYLSKHESKGRAFLMHLILILNNLILGLIPVILGVLFFFVKAFRVWFLTYFRLADYYLNVLKTGSWLSARSVNYASEDKVTEQQEVYPELKRVISPR